MKIQEMKSEYRMQEMQKMIRARTESGLTVSEWCQENNFSEGSYYYWLKKIREKTIEEVETGNEIVQVPIMLQKTAERKIKPVRIKYKDMELEIPCGMGTEDILAVLRAVKSC